MNAQLAALLDEALRGDMLALERLLAACQDRLIARIARRLPPAVGGAVSPEDVLQEVYRDVFERFSTLEQRNIGGFLRWLLRIADSRVIDCIRTLQAAKRGGGRAVLGLDADASAQALVEYLATASHTPSRSAARHEHADLLLSALERLSPDYRDVLRLRYLEGFSVAEVAARLGRSEFSVHKLCSRGLTRLRDELGDAGRFFSSG
jgi:RNA polymerase sigma-70 factor (ECF subfamily)